MQTLERLEEVKKIYEVTCPFCARYNIFTLDRLALRVCAHYSHMRRTDFYGEVTWYYSFVKPGDKARKGGIKIESERAAVAEIKALKQDVAFLKAELVRADLRYNRLLERNKSATRKAAYRARKLPAADTQSAEQGG